MNKLYKKAYLKRGKLHEYYGDYEAALTDYSALNFIGKFESEHDRKIMDGALEKLVSFEWQSKFHFLTSFSQIFSF